ncbi:MAG TPA: hypothetical protein VFO10_08075 [Oligoflexus sp.]|uniref:hypothetical protein n=1 Tax=Oligoflexus sp. TaxID=1971216 RepID=UPI002D7F4F54|nr:hypothetical protein [Oligoflexus sp.]HET9237193.1 hypothetical protein [Oligoflexus sp.]
MQNVALGFLWQDGDTGIMERARKWSDTIARVYIVDLRESGEDVDSLDDPRLHYAPFRDKTSLGQGLNRALRLAYEEGMAWLWILDGRTDITQDELLLWTRKAEPRIGLYLGTVGSRRLNPLSRPSCALLVSVAVARSLGGWNPVLPARQVFADFEERLKARGGTLEKGLKVRQIPSEAEGRGLWAFARRHFFGAGTKSR